MESLSSRAPVADQPSRRGTSKGGIRNGSEGNEFACSISVIEFNNRCKNPTARRMTMSAKWHPLLFFAGIAVLGHCVGSASAQVKNDSFRFDVSASAVCGKELICLEGAHVYSNATSKFDRRITLVADGVDTKRQSMGMVLYGQPARLLDPATRRAASFNATFTTDLIMETWDPNNIATANRGDGMTWIMTADGTNSSVGTAAKCLGAYDNLGRRGSKTVVVEFDTWKNDGEPFLDISQNHVSLEFMNITPVASVNASDVGVELWYGGRTLYYWIEYSAASKVLEVRVSNFSTRPVLPLLTHEVDLFAVSAEEMFVGFSSGNGDHYASYYITDWKFESYGIPPRGKGGGKGPGVGVIAALAVCVPAVVMAAVVLGFVLKRRYVRKEGLDEDPMAGLDLSGMVESFSYKQLSVATGAFGEVSKLGHGGFGTVYRGVLPTTGQAVAVKRIGADSKQGAREFVAEVSIISQLRHRNLIELRGWCNHRGVYLLVYELMPNGSLDKVLFHPSGEPSPLSWAQRFKILTGTAAALDYLHHGWKRQVIHRDIKSSNIMLDDQWNAKLGDFGLARLVDHQGPAATTLVAGTYGYIAPEAATSGRFTAKTDVFAFGAVALEIACGRRALCTGAPPDEMLLVDWVWRRLSEGRLLSVVDPGMGEYDTYWMEVVLLTGLLCSHPDPESRPSLRHVLEILEGAAPVPSIPLSKPAAVFDSDPQRISIAQLFNNTGQKSFGKK